jgi:hypothetical protein
MDGHFNELGNRIFAGVMSDWLAPRVPAPATGHRGAAGGGVR